MANGLSTFINMLGQKPQPGFAAGMMKGQDEALARRKLEEEMERAEALAPYELLKAQGEAEQGPQLTAEERKYQFWYQQTGSERLAMARSLDTLGSYDDPVHGRIYYDHLGPIPASEFDKEPQSSAPPTAGQDVPPGAEESDVAPPTVGQQEQALSKQRDYETPAQREERVRLEKQEEDKKTHINTRTGALTKELHDSNILPLGKSLDILNQGLQEVGANKEHIPGVGLENWAHTMSDMFKGVPVAEPVLNSLANALTQTKFLGTPEGKKVQQLARNAAAQYMKMISGADVTDEEREYYKGILGQTNWADPEQFLLGIQVMSDAYNTVYGNIRAGYSDEVLSEYEKRQQREQERITGKNTEQEDKKGKDKEQGKIPPPEDPNERWKIIREANPNAPEDRVLEAAKEKGRLPPDYTPPPAEQGSERSDERSSVEPTTTPGESGRGQRGRGAATREVDPLQETVSLLRNELDSGTSKKDIKKRVDSMKANKEITQREYVQIMRELQLGTYDAQAQRSSRGRGQRGGGTR